MHFLLSLQVIIKYDRFQGQLIATPELYPYIAAILKKRKSKHCLQQKYADKEKKIKLILSPEPSPLSKWRANSPPEKYSASQASLIVRISTTSN